MNENDLIDRWTLKAENPKEFAALNLAVERAKLAKGYKPGQSAAEKELAARQADLVNRRNAYIGEQRAQAAKATPDPVTTRIAGDVDFSTHTPYVKFDGDSDSYRRGQKRRSSHSVDPEGDGKPSKAEVGKRFDAFQKEVASLQGDQMSARSAGQATYKRKAREMAEQKARMALANPPNTYGLHVDIPKPALSGEMEFSGRNIPVPHGGHFDEQAFAPRVASSPAFEPEQPVGDGDLPNDDIQGTPETQDFEKPAAPAFTDWRKPAGGVMAPSTRPVAHREY